MDESSAGNPEARRRLESWKAIARYLRRNVRTVQRWERDEGLPIRRHEHRKQATVFAYSDEIDRWRAKRATAIPRDSARGPSRTAVAAGAAIVLLAAVVLAWFFGRGTEPADGDSVPAGAGPSIAVLPFQNRSEDDAMNYFSVGVTDDIINLLATIPELRVTSRTSSFYVGSLGLDLPGVAEQLGVEHVLEGSVWLDGEQVRVAVNLIDANSDTLLDAFRLERPADEMVQVQAEIATAIANRLSVSLGRISEIGRRTANPRAEQLYLQARFESRKRSADTINAAIAHLSEAIELDPGFAAAHAELAGAYLALPGYSKRREDSFRVMLPRALAAARRAIELDPSLSKPYAILGAEALFEMDYVRARELAERAIGLAPNDSDIRVWYGMLLSAVGDKEGAFEQFLTALRIDPLSAMTNRFVGIGLRNLGRRNEAIAYLDSAIELGGTNALYVRALEHLRDGRMDEALRLLESWARSHGIDERWAGIFANATQDAVHRPQAIEWIAELEAEHRDIGAATYATIGALDEAFASAQSEIDSGTVPFLLSASDPELADFRSDPRFADLVLQTGLGNYWDIHGWIGYCTRANEGLTCR